VREQNITSAIDEVKRGVTQREAAQNWGIPQATLCDRIHGATNKKTSKLANRRLSPEEESFLVDWCLNEEASARPPSKAQITRMAAIVLAEGGDFTPIGYRWVDRFLARHTRVQTKKSVLLESARKRGSTKEAYEEFYGLLSFHLESKAIRHTNIANIDKHGM